jgi:hypothetical protein
MLVAAVAASATTGDRANQKPNPSTATVAIVETTSIACGPKA